MGIIILVILTIAVLGAIWLMSKNSPEQEYSKREQRKVELRAQGFRGRLDAIIDQEEQPKSRWSFRPVRRRR